MIQRIQSLYLLIVAALMAVASGVAPLARILSSDVPIDVTAFGLRAEGAAEFLAKTSHIGILMVICAVVPFATIFLYKHRQLQLRLCVVELVLLPGALGMEIGLLVKARRAVADLELSRAIFTAVDLFPLVAIIVMWLATRAIFKDMILVKSLDRIR